MSILNHNTTAALIFGMNSILGSESLAFAQVVKEDEIVYYQLINLPQKVESALNTEISKEYLLNQSLSADDLLFDLKYFALTQSSFATNEQVSLEEDFMKALNSVTIKLGKDKPKKSRF